MCLTSVGLALTQSQLFPAQKDGLGVVGPPSRTDLDPLTGREPQKQDTVLKAGASPCLCFPRPW